MARRLAPPEFRVWYTRHGDQKWGVLRASSLQEAQRAAKKKYGNRLVSVKPIEKAATE